MASFCITAKGLSSHSHNHFLLGKKVVGSAKGVFVAANTELLKAIVLGKVILLGAEK